MRKLTLLILLLMVSLFLFFYFTGEYGLGTEAQETENTVSNAINEDQQSEDESNDNEGNNVNAEDYQIDEQQDTETSLSDNVTEEAIEVEVPIPGTETYYKGVHVVDNPDDIIVLVNKENVLQSDYEPADLVKLSKHAPGRTEVETYMREEAEAAVMELVNAAETEAELEILPASAYRSYETQRIIFENNVNIKGSVEKANRTSALPGQSEHQTGLAVDMSCSSVGYQIKNAFGETEEAEWLADHAYRFGFIIRYPEGKKEITGYSYEPWHLRYVGKELAEYIKENEMTLEEYYESSNH